MAAMQAAPVPGAFYLTGTGGVATIAPSEIDVKPQAISITRDRKPATFVVDMEVSP
jgi:hypothetical protein